MKQRFPATPAHRVWTNFEFIAGDGSINEVDMLAVTPRGVFVVEIKSWPERIEGDQGTWYRAADERRERAEDNPLRLTNLKAKRLKSLLESKSSRRRGRLPFFQALVFLSHPEVQPRLDKVGRLGVTVRDAEGGRPAPGGLPGVIEALTAITAEDRGRGGFKPLTTRDAGLIAGALDEAGIRESRRHRRVGDYDLNELIDEGPGYQEYAARHASLPETERRIRIFTSSSGLEREIVVRAAKREFQSLDSLEHPGILTPRDYVEHELGPALIYDREAGAITLDHYLAVHGGRLDFEQRLTLVRAIAEALAYAHARGVIHRALSPRGILVVDPAARAPRIRIRDWHTAQRAEVTSGGSEVSRTGLLEQMVAASVELYLAPEAPRSRTGEHLDVFSLGAIAFHVFAGVAPASSLIERQAHLDQLGGLDIGSIADGVPESQRLCVFVATCPDVSQRTESVKAFLVDLDEVEDELTEPATGEEIDPTTARKGDELLDYEIEARLGSGASSVAYLTAVDDEKRVLKVAIEPARNESLKSEASVLARVREPGIVRLYRDDLRIGGHEAILIEYAGRETLAERIKREGPLGLELLERLGEDLLRSVSALEDQGIYHRDIKPANIGIGRRGRSNQLRLILFDFSLSRAPLDSIAVGTPAYLDPFLGSPARGRFDLPAERFAAAMTLYEMATGQLPKWGDGLSDPAAIETEVTIDSDLLGSVGSLPSFFRCALSRSPADRFDTAEEMLRGWRECFQGVDEPVSTGHDEATEDRTLLEAANGASPVRELGLSARALNALERAEILTVSTLLETSEFNLRSLPGVGAGTRSELIAAFEFLRDRMSEGDAPDVQGLDLLIRQLVPQRGWEERDLEVVRAFLGLEGPAWSGVAAVAKATERDGEEVQSVLDRARERWGKSLPSVTRLRDEIAEMLDREGGVLPARMLEEGVLARRGAVAEGEERSHLATASARAAVETEERRESPRFVAIRVGDAVAVVSSPAVDVDAVREYLASLGSKADELVSDGPVDQIRAVDELDSIPVPDGMPSQPRARLVRIAAAIAPQVAANERGELYPVGMSAELALRRIAGSFAIGLKLPLEQVEDRLHARYPLAGPSPPRDVVDEILAEYGLDWEPGSAHYTPRSTTRATGHRSSHRSVVMGAESNSSFAQRLERSRDRFLALTARTRYVAHAERALSNLERIHAVELDAALIEQMKTIAAEKNATWEAVLQVDAAGPGGRSWKVLIDLAAGAAERLRDQLSATSGTVLASRPGLLARYGQLGVLADLRRQVDDSAHELPLKGLWLLVPANSGPPTIGDTLWPVIDENEWARVPSDWIGERA